MKPLKLKMKGFGPYLNQVEIDFTELEDSLTLISGNTGAGKTTVFDAICCALFGATSGKGRDFGEMRSKNAEDKDKTEIDFTFELHGQTYRVVRSPSYSRKNLKSKTTAVAELTLPSGDIIRKVGVVNERIQEILGIGKDEFRQIVMIAQNDFMAMVKETGGSQEKTFNRIFDATLYKNFSERIKEKQKASFNEVQKYISLIKNNVENSGLTYEKTLVNENYIDPYYVLSKLDSERVQKESKITGLESSKNELDKKVTDIRIELHDSEEVNSKFDKLEETQRVLQHLSEQKDSIKNLEFSKKRAETARDVVSTSYNTWMNFITHGESLKNDLDKYQDSLRFIEDELKQNEKDLDDFPKIELDNLKMKYDSLSKSLPQYGKLSEYQTELDDLTETIAREQDQLTQKQNNKESLEAKLNTTVIKDDSELQFREEVIRSDGRKVQSLFEINEELEKDIGDIVEKASKLLEQELKHRKIDLSRRDLEQKLKEANDIFIQNSAAYLAEGLENGKPCPVCGSIEHPKVAVSTLQEVTQEDLENLQQQVSEIQNTFLKQYQVVQEYRSLISNHLAGIELKINTLTETYNKEDLDQLRDGIDSLKNLAENSESFELNIVNELTQSLGVITDSYRVDLNERIIELKKSLRDLNEEKEANNKRKKLLEQWSNELKTIEKELKELEDSQQKHDRRSVELKAKIGSLQESLDYESLEDATVALNQFKTTIDKFDKKLKNLEEANNSLKQQKNEELGKYLNTQSQIDENNKNITESENKLIKNLKAGEFESVDDYLESLIKPERLTKITEEINNYYERLNQNQHTFTELSQALENSATRF